MPLMLEMAMTLLMEELVRTFFPAARERISFFRMVEEGRLPGRLLLTGSRASSSWCGATSASASSSSRMREMYARRASISALFSAWVTGTRCSGLTHAEVAHT